MGHTRGRIQSRWRRRSRRRTRRGGGIQRRRWIQWRCAGRLTPTSRRNRNKRRRGESISNTLLDFRQGRTMASVQDDGRDLAHAHHLTPRRRDHLGQQLDAERRFVLGDGVLERRLEVLQDERQREGYLLMRRKARRRGGCVCGAMR